MEVGRRPSEERARIAVANDGNLIDEPSEPFLPLFDRAAAEHASGNNARFTLSQLAFDKFGNERALRNAEQARIANFRPCERDGSFARIDALCEEFADGDYVLVSNRPNDVIERAGFESCDLRATSRINASSYSPLPKQTHIF